VIRWALLALLVGGCAQQHELRRATRALGKSVARGDVERIRDSVPPHARAQLDVAALTRSKRAWARTLARPRELRAEAIVFLSADQPVRAVLTPHGWRFAEDPSAPYEQSTPAQALRALVLATRRGRWDVVLGLAPKRYRVGLSPADLEEAWTEGEQGAALRQARDRLARHLADPIAADDHEAVLDMGQGRAARLEREGDRWVVVDF
jgi:hypothetical protein